MRRTNERIPVIVGISDPGMDNLVSLAKSSMDAGCSGVMIGPRNGLQTDANIFNYFTQVFEQLGDEIPVCYQDYPQITNVFISVDSFNHFIRQFNQLVMFKHEDCPGLGKLTQIRQTAEADVSLRRVSILVGNGGYICLKSSQGGQMVP